MFQKILLLFLFPLHCFGIAFDFSQGAEGWVGDFTDFPVGGEAFYELAWGWENLPSSDQKGLYISGNNHSDDLFMFLRRQIDGLEPNCDYTLHISIVLESNVPEHCIGIGGAPGESLFVKIGASTVEPTKVDIHGFYHLNVDKGNQSQGGQNAIVVGDLANAAVNPNSPSYLPKELEGTITVKSDAAGKVWIFIGTDSGYEGPSKFYLTHVKIAF